MIKTSESPHAAPEDPANNDPVKVDIIGDVHGCYKPLLKLLQRLGYKPVNGVYQHPERLAVFVGDLIDRGPHIRETLELVHDMHQAGRALVVLGNHEYNAIRFKQETLDYLLDQETQGMPARLKKLMKETLDQFRDFPEQWQKYTEWFSQLPLFIETPTYRVVHACWDDTLIQAYKSHYPLQGITPEFIQASREKGSLESRTVDRLTRGTSMPLPDGMQLESKDGFIRRFFRTKFWEESPKTYGDIVFQPDPLPYDLADHPIHSTHKQNLLQYEAGAPPVFFGHYWLKGRPRPLQPNVACLDYSAVSFGRLTAYRFDGEKELREDRFQWVYVDRGDSTASDTGKGTE
ncbi:metallophosphoesterase [Pseudomaricurvus sp.]|uniref:metallophosphoesterase n=1 Tax=Pseudomaricurvus sp. TaxID=2004510 RepID=UPI003F6BA026